MKSSSNESSRQKVLAYSALGICILCLSTSAIFVKVANAPGPVTGFYRMLIAACVLTPAAIYRLSKNKSLNRKNFWIPLAGGIFSGLDLGIWTISLGLTTASNATILGNTAPLWVALGAMVLFHEKLRKKFWLGLILAMTGVILIVGSDFFIHPRFGIGDSIAIFTGMLYAGYYLTTEYGRKSLDAVTYIWLVFLSGSVTLLILNLIMRNPLTGYDKTTILVFFATALISQLLGYLMSSYSLGHLPASIVSVTMIGQPIVTTIIAIPILGEIPGTSQMLGGMIALAGIYLVNISHNRI